MNTQTFRSAFTISLAVAFISATLAATVFVFTSPHGLGLSNDSPRYLRTAESLITQGRLEFPITGWNDDESTRSLFRHAPFLPLLLAAISGLTTLGVEDAAHWLNALCMFGTTFLIFRPARLQIASVFVLAALILSPAIWNTHLYFWSEPLFLFLLVLTFRLVELALTNGKTSFRLAVALGFVCGIMTLTRYAGLFVLPCVLLTLLMLRQPLDEYVKRAAALAVTYFAVAGPWFLFLRSIRRSARSLAIESEGFPTAMVHTFVHWFIPQPHAGFLPGWVGIEVYSLILIAASALFGAQYFRNRNRSEEATPCVPTWGLAAAWVVAYLVFIFVAKTVADPAIRYTNRMLSPAYVMLVMGLVDGVRFLPKSRVLQIAVAVWSIAMAVENFNQSKIALADSWQYGLGYSDYRIKDDAVSRWLAEQPRTVTVYTNEPGRLSSVQPVSVKSVPRKREDLPAFVRRVSEARPSAVVLFPFPKKRRVGREDIQRAFSKEEFREIGSAVVIVLW